MAQHKQPRRILAMAMSVVMMLGITPITAFAETSPVGTSGAIIAFEALSEETANREVSLGTSLKKLNLPNALNATVRVATETDATNNDAMLIQGSGEPQFEEKGLSVPVEWASDPDYDGDMPGTYTFTAEVTDDSYIVSLALPTITVTVLEDSTPAQVGEVTAFDPLDEDIATQSVPIGAPLSALVLSKTLPATVNGAAVSVPVTWTSLPEYNPDSENEEAGEYIFTPLLGEGYTMAEDVSVPRIIVTTAAPVVALRGMSDSTVDITEDMSDIGGAIETALTTNDIVIVTGSKSDSNSLSFTIPNGKTVVWEAQYSMSSINSSMHLRGFGALEISKDGKVESNGVAMLVMDGIIVTVNGTLTSTSNGYTIALLNTSSLIVGSGGVVSNTFGSGMAVGSLSDSSVIVDGGTVTSVRTAINMFGSDVIIKSGMVQTNSNEATIILWENATGVFSGGTVKNQYESTQAVSVGTTSTVFVSGGEIVTGGIKRSTDSTSVGYYIGSENNAKFAISGTNSFTLNTDLFPLDVVESVNTNGEAHEGIESTRHDVVAQLSNKLDLSDATVTASAGNPEIDHTNKTVTFIQNTNGTINPTIIVSGARVAATNIDVPTFTTPTFDVNINKVLGGTVGVSGIAAVEKALTVDLSALTPAADDGRPALKYQWQFSADGSTEWADIPEATGETYTAAPGFVNKYLRVAVTPMAASNFNGTISSNAVLLDKADGPAAPTVTGSYTGNGMHFTYTVTPVSGAEYKMSEGNWQNSNVFAGITPESTHTFYARINETETHKAGLVADTGLVTFSKLSDRSAPALAYTVSGSFPKTVTITAVSGAEYKFGNADWSDTNTYTSTAAESITLSIRLKATATQNASAESSVEINTANQNQTAPAAFTLTYADVNETSYTVTIPTTAGAEYSFDGTNWNSVNTKSSLMPGETVTGYKRMAAREGFNASPAVSDSVMLPQFQVKTPTSSPNGGTFTTGQSVSLSSTTAGAKIYYTTDGSTPTVGSTLYTTTISLSATTTIKAIAVKEGMTSSALLTVTFTKQGGGSGGGSGSGGGYTPPVTTPPTTTTPEVKPNQPVTAAAPVTASAGQNGTASATIPEKSVTDAIAKAQADAKAQGKVANGIGVSVNITIPANTKSLGLVLPQLVLKQLADAKVQQFEVNGQLLTLNLDQEAIGQLLSQSTGDVTVTIKPVTVEGVRNTYEITFTTIKDGKTVTITSLGSGSATLSIPCTPAKNEAAGYLYAVYVDAKGKHNRISGSAYDANSRSMIFSTNHFSVYGVGYEAPSAKFTDIGSHWAKESIDYACHWR